MDKTLYQLNFMDIHPGEYFYARKYDASSMYAEYFQLRLKERKIVNGIPTLLCEDVESGLNVDLSMNSSYELFTTKLMR